MRVSPMSAGPRIDGLSPSPLPPPPPQQTCGEFNGARPTLRESVQYLREIFFKKSTCRSPWHSVTAVLKFVTPKTGVIFFPSALSLFSLNWCIREQGPTSLMVCHCNRSENLSAPTLLHSRAHGRCLSSGDRRFTPKVGLQGLRPRQELLAMLGE